MLLRFASCEICGGKKETEMNEVSGTEDWVGQGGQNGVTDVKVAGGVARFSSCRNKLGLSEGGTQWLRDGSNSRFPVDMGLTTRRTRFWGIESGNQCLFSTMRHLRIAQWV